VPIKSQGVIGQKQVFPGARAKRPSAILALDGAALQPVKGFTKATIDA
jgi:hypothetical protein